MTANKIGYVGLITQSGHPARTSAAHRTIAPRCQHPSNDTTRRRCGPFVNIYLPLAGYNAPTSSKR